LRCGYVRAHPPIVASTEPAGDTAVNPIGRLDDVAGIALVLGCVVD
jgi:hypothetical protein